MLLADFLLPGSGSRFIEADPDPADQNETDPDPKHCEKEQCTALLPCPRTTKNLNLVYKFFCFLSFILTIVVIVFTLHIMNSLTTGDLPRLVSASPLSPVKNCPVLTPVTAASVLSAPEMEAVKRHLFDSPAIPAKPTAIVKPRQEGSEVTGWSF